MTARRLLHLALLAAWLAALSGLAAPVWAGGKLPLTAGVTGVDGAAGGGLGPWALIGTGATVGEFGAAAHATTLRTRHYALATAGVALAWDDRVELSLARQALDTRDNLLALGLAGLHLRQDILGLKLRVVGDAVLDSDRYMPQIALGVLHKRSNAGDLAPVLLRPGPLGAREQDTELYLSATKLWLSQGLLGNLTLRATRANQGGLLGHGSRTQDRHRVMPEASLVWLLSPRLAVGVEARAKPDNLNDSALGAGALKEDPWFDAFVAWVPWRPLTVTLAWVDLGRIVPALQPRRQTGGLLSLQLAY